MAYYYKMLTSKVTLTLPKSRIFSCQIFFLFTESRIKGLREKDLQKNNRSIPNKCLMSCVELFDQLFIEYWLLIGKIYPQSSTVYKAGLFTNMCNPCEVRIFCVLFIFLLHSLEGIIIEGELKTNEVSVVYAYKCISMHDFLSSDHAYLQSYILH